MSKRNNKTTLVSIGISRYISNGYRNIEAAEKDAISIFNTFHRVLGDNLDIVNSTAKKSIRADEFSTLLKNSLSQGSSCKGILIFYFSGHARVYNKSLELVFKDADAEDHEGFVPITEIKRLIDLSGLQALIILDCCYASAGKFITQPQDSLSKSKVSLIASSKEYEPSNYTDGSSLFTASLITSINKLEALGKEISLVEVMKLLKEDWPIDKVQNPSLFQQEGETEVVIKRAFFESNQKSKIIDDFISELAEIPEKERELLWYAISEEREGLLLDAVLQLIKYPSFEASWLVRRAVGSALNKITNLKAEKAKACTDLIKTADWSMKAIGVIGGRNSLENEPNLQSEYFKILNSDCPMDVKWLAFLYLCDAGLLDEKDVSIVESTGLLSTSWGVCEYWHRHCQSAQNELRISRTKSLLKHCKLESIRSALIEYIYRYSSDYAKISSACGFNEHTIPKQTKSILDTFKEKSTRGRTKSLGIRKWLYSRLYGGWRGEHENFIVDHIKNLSAISAGSFITHSAKNPDVAGRMAIFDQLKTDINIFHKHIAVLSWGAEDPHPWVRRSAIDSFIHVVKNGLEIETDSIIQKALSAAERCEYPGTLDLIISITKLASMKCLSKEGYQRLTKEAFSTLSPYEIDALNREFKSEALPYEIPKQ